MTKKELKTPLFFIFFIDKIITSENTHQSETQSKPHRKF